MGTRQFSMLRNAVLIAFVVGCAVGAPMFSEGISQLAEISVDESASDVTKIRFDLDQVTSWSSYRADGGDLVIELAETVVGSFVEVPPISGGIIRGIEIESDPDGPVTRIRVLDGDTEHEIVPHGNSLEMLVRPLGAIAELATEPMGEALVAESEATDVAADPDLAEVETAIEAAEAVRPSGTSDEPFLAAALTQFAGTRVVAVETASHGGEVSVYIRGDGSFAYSAFSLDGPDRFVIDLLGIVVGVEGRAIGIDEALVRQVRLAQYREDPQPVTRVVFDLWSPYVPWVESVADGVVVRFGFTHAAEVAQVDLPGTPETTFLESAEAETLEPAMVVIEETMATETGELADAVVEKYDEVTDLVENFADSIETDYTTLEEAEPEVATDPGPVDEIEGQVAKVVDELDQIAEDLESVGESEYQSADDIAATVAEDVAVQNGVAEDVAEDAASDIAETEYQYQQSEPESTQEIIAQAVPDVSYEPVAAASESAYHNQQDLTVTTGEATSDPNPATGFERQQLASGQRQYTGEPIDLSLQDSDVRDVLRSLAQLSGLNLVVQPGVTGRVTVEFVQVPWDQALEQILKINSLGYEVEGTIMRVAPLNQLRQEAEERQRLAQVRAAAVPLTTVIQRVSYAKANVVARILSARGGIMSQRGSVVVDERTNTLIIKELPAYVDTVLSVIENLDIAEPQVMIEARIIETTKRFSRTLGINWGFGGIADNEHGNTTGLVFPNNAQVDGGVSLLTGARNGFVDLSLGNVLNTFNLDIALQAAENEGLINVLSEPRISTLNNERATIQSGLQIPIQTVANNTVSVQFVNATLRLDVTPQVTADGTVLMDVRIQKREPQPAFAVAGAANAPIATKEASTRVIVRDGGTTVIGGIYEVSSDQGEDRVPGLGKVKGIGNLFKNRRRNDENQELLIFITPRVIRL